MTTLTHVAPDGPHSLPTGPYQHRSILVVDDDEDTAELLVELLRRRGFDAAFVCSAPACLHHLSSTHVDLVVTDIGMPVMSGLQLCARLRESYPEVAVVILTGFGGVETGRCARLAGASDFVVKPVRIQPLADVLIRALEQLAH